MAGITGDGRQASRAERIAGNATVLAVAAALLGGCSRAKESDAAAQGAAAAKAQPAADVAAELEDGFVPITLDQCEVFYGKGERTGQTWEQDAAVLRCSGTPRGYLYTKRSYGDCVLRCDFRFPQENAKADKPELSNTGFLIYVTEPHKQWPKSLEVQGRFDQMGAIKANGGAVEPELAFHDQAAREQARKPLGEWNSIEIISRDGALTAVLNGTKICESRPTDLREGQIGLQSEDFPVEFRNVRLHEEGQPAEQ